jgi:hypothetical protein
LDWPLTDSLQQLIHGADGNANTLLQQHQKIPAKVGIRCEPKLIEPFQNPNRAMTFQ